MSKQVVHPSPTERCEIDADALQVARLRSALDWMLMVPQWETSLELALLALGFKGHRQGIAFRKAALSLPILQKCELLRNALREGLEPPSNGEAKRLANLWGVTSFRQSSSFETPSARSWRQLCNALALRLSARQSDYLAARDALFERYAPLADSTASMRCSSVNRSDDARQEARIALLQAIDRIEPGQSFQAYARQWIKRRVLNFVMTESLPVRAPINLISRSFSQQGQASPESARLLHAIREGIVSLDDEGCGSQTRQSLSTESSESPAALAIETNERRLLADALRSLSEKQSSVLALRFGLASNAGPRSLGQIAKTAGISRQQVAQREKRALRKLASTLRELGRERSASLAQARD